MTGHDHIGRAATPLAAVALGGASALIQNQSLVRDGLLIPADGPQSACDFAAALIGALDAK